MAVQSDEDVDMLCDKSVEVAMKTLCVQFVCALRGELKNFIY